MAADKLPLQPKRFHLSVDTGLDAAHIGEDRMRRQMLFQSEQIFVVAGDRRAQENIVAVRKGSVDGRADLIQYLLLQSQLQGILPDIIGDQTCLRICCADGPGDGTADQPQADKTTGERIHMFDTFLFGKI